MKLLSRHWRQGCMALMLWSASMLHAQQGISLSEDRAKAAYILNFIRLVEWPESAFFGLEAPLSICVMGSHERYESLLILRYRRVNNRLLTIRHEKILERIGSCHIVFISQSESKRLTSILHHLDGLAVLTVSDIDGFIDAGGAIGLVHDEERLEFEVNREALRKASLTASSNLLKLARNLRGWN